MRQKGIYIPHAIDLLTGNSSCEKIDEKNRWRERVAKRIAVIVRDREAEALRMAVGLTLADDKVDVYVVDRKLESNEANDLNIEMLGSMKARVYSNNPENNFEQKTTEEMAEALTGYDVVIPY
jgi:hypothetical protein